MKSNYKPIGNYIKRVEKRNTDLKVTKLLGLSMTKEFRETTSNIVGTDMSVYRVMNKWQFACDFMSPIRVNKLPVVLKTDEEPNLVSPAYPVFEVKDKNELDPEYLMMWFRRSEFDRYAAFKCDSAIRGGYDWDELCNTLIPVPKIETQKEIVTEYNIIVNRINLNNQLIQKLEETAQAIYKQWFVDFEFPNEDGKPYKSSGGEMVFNSELEKEIPLGWSLESIFNITSVQYGFPFNSDLFCSDDTLKPIIRIRDIITNVSTTFSSEIVDEKYLIQDGDILIGMDGEFHINIWFGGNAYQNQRIVRLRNNRVKNISSFQLSFSIHQPIKELESSSEGTTVAHLSDKDMKGLRVLVATESIQKEISTILENISVKRIFMAKENILLSKLRSILLSKLATIGN